MPLWGENTAKCSNNLLERLFKALHNNLFYLNTKILTECNDGLMDFFFKESK